MTRKYLVDGSDLPDSATVQKGRGDLDSAADGSVAAAQAIIRDPTGVLAFEPWTELAWEDDACSRPRGWTGYVANATVSRGPYTVGAGVIHTLELFDLNSLLHRQVFHLASAKRPRESGNARMAWLLASEALAGRVFDNGRVASNPWMFDEADYRGKYADDVLADISVSSIDDELGLTSGVYWDDAAASGEERSLFYHSPTATTGTSTISLSNVDADVNNTTCFWIHPDPVLSRQGEDIYCGVWFETRDGGFHAHSDTTHAAFFAGKPHRDGAFSTDRISLGATATAHAARWLANHSGFIDTLKLTARLTPAAVNLLDAGMRVSVHLPHLPGYESPIYLRVRRRSVPIEEGKRLWYDIPLELSLKGVPQAAGGNPSNYPYPPPGAPSVVQHAPTNMHGHLEADFPVTDGHLELLWAVSRTGNMATPDGWDHEKSVHLSTVDGDACFGTLFSRVASGDGTPDLRPLIPAGQVISWFETDAAAIDAFAIGSVGDTPLTCGGPITPSAGPALVMGFGSVGVFFGAAVAPDDGLDVLEVDFPASPPDSPHNWVATKVVTSPAATTIGGTVTGAPGHLGSAGVTVVLLGTAVANPPSPGQWVYGETPTPPPDGVTTTFYTAYPFADGSLQITVDGIRQTAAATDGAARSFTTPFALSPSDGQQMTVSYQGR